MYKMHVYIELHPWISHLQEGVNAIHWRKACLHPEREQQRLSLCHCTEERHRNSRTCVTHNVIRLFALPAAEWILKQKTLTLKAVISMTVF